MALDQDKMRSLMEEILQEDFVELDVDSYRLDEKFQDGKCRINCRMRRENDEHLEVSGEGVGTIDALFTALRSHLAADYPSLKSIRFSEFTIRGLISSDGDEDPTKAEAEATVGIVNSEGRHFVFQAKDRSVSRAGILATVQAAEYFVNSERTYVRLHEILEHYRNQGRTDLVEKYTDLMSQVVQNTSYSEVVEQIRQAMDDDGS